MKSSLLNTIIKLSFLTLLTLTLCACSIFNVNSTKQETQTTQAPQKQEYSQEAKDSFALAYALWETEDNCSDPEQAIALLNKVIQLEPNYAEAYLWRGLALSELTKWEEAFDDITKAIRLDPSAMNYAYRGLVSMHSGNTIGAQRDLDESIRINPHQHRAYNFRGTLNVLLEKVEAACEDFNKACLNGDCGGLNLAKEAGHCL
ncbi:tetratricopeptide repeat protein [Desulfovibrio litoralis]|uniref:Tetratricopeptide repeat-containing protein n=1 Tax=Desulfovibrio litoralis DSM 11393 TaxID=1121455 RepID=A0A1M7T3S1_9BACT|nr:tetratricopeptide repeat protein [Desulfovibrio litoralis]SHN65415.1 Tetratricopeptide repeat-containing protein [Desulfovibrio litoralis DSM 11393]